MNQYDIAIFDVDGTLLDTKEGIIKAIRQTARVNGLRPIKEEEEAYFVGPPIQESLMKVYGVTKEEAQRIANDFRAIYKEDDYLLKALPYEGILAVCEELVKRDVKIAVATYKRQDYAVKICEHFGFHHFSNVIYGADNENKLKKPDIIELCLKHLQVTDYKRAVMIGDSVFDAMGAQQIGTDFIGVTYGFDFKTEQDVMKYEAVGYAAEPGEILKFF